MRTTPGVGEECLASGSVDTWGRGVLYIQHLGVGEHYLHNTHPPDNRQRFAITWHVGTQLARLVQITNGFSLFSFI